MSRLTRMTALIWPSHSVPAKLLPGANTSTMRVSWRDRHLLVGGLVYIERRDFVAQLGDSVMQGGLVGFDLAIRWTLPAAACSNAFFASA